VTGVNPRLPSWRLLSAVLLLACAHAAGAPHAPAPEFASLEREVAHRVNAYRTAHRLPALTYDTAVARIARAHSRDMAAQRVPLGHDGFNRRVDQLERFLPLVATAENVAFNTYSANSTVRVAVNGWLASPHHLENIEGKYDVTGVGIARAGDGTFYYTQLFVRGAVSPRR
jgi:uncharacterized protein YkwD